MIINRITGILLLVSVISFVNAFGQDLPEKSIKTGVGFGMHMGKKTDGIGMVYTIGYQQEIWNERFRLNPNISFGRYSSKFMPLDARDQYFNSTNLELNLFFDLSKSDTFSLVLVGGGLLNNTSGMLGEVGDPEAYYEDLHSEYVNDFHLGTRLGAGFRINSLSNKTSLNIMPFNLNIGTQGFVEFTPRIEVDIKF